MSVLFKDRRGASIAVIVAAFGCSGHEGSSSRSSDNADGSAMSGSGAASNSFPMSGSGGASSGSDGAGAGAGGPSGTGAATSGPYEGLVRLPDVDSTPVASCTGKADMTLCSVATVPDRSYDICSGGACVSPGCGQTTCNAPAPHFVIPPGSEHVYLERDSGSEPVVVDLVTGLHWQGCPSGYSGPSCEGGSYQDMTWDEALAYCDSLVWAGKDDWYLPDSYELMSIFDYAHDEGRDVEFFPGLQQMFWTSHAVSDSLVIALQFEAASTWAASPVWERSPSRALTARCVRRGFSRDAGYANQRFVVTEPGPVGEPIVTDPATTLVWQRCVAGHSGRECDMGTRNELTVPEWRSHCDGLAWAGYDDWRLPTYKELYSLLEYPIDSGFEARVDVDVFDADEGAYLAATSGYDDNAVGVLFDVRGGDKTGPTSDYPILCVRWASDP